MFEIIFVLIGTFVGAGFASGREVLNFFTIYNYHGIISIFVFSFLLFFLVLKCLNIKEKLNINNYNEFVMYLQKKYIFINSKFFLFIINLFLAISFYLMLSSLGSLFLYQFNLSKIITITITISFCFYVLLKDKFDFIYKINFILMPILLCFILFLSINNINFNNITSEKSSNLFFSIFMGILYFSYNSLLLIPVIFNFKSIKNYNNILISFIFSIIILILLLFLNFLLLCFLGELLYIDIPIIYLCNYSFRFLGFFIILSAILTTLLSSGYSFINNLNKKNIKLKLFIFLSFSFIFSSFPFSDLIDFFYPIFGLIGLFQIFLILFNSY